jgi:hypothetical protein
VDVLAGQAAEKAGYSKIMTIAHLKLRIAEKFMTKKEEWHKSSGRHGTEEIPSPPPIYFFLFFFILATKQRRHPEERCA